MDIAGKKAVVIGGTSGIGRATSLMLAERGASVIAVSRDPSKADDVASLVKLAALDTRETPEVEAFFAARGDIDILVNAATGGSRSFGPFLEMDVNGFKGSFDKLWGYANVVRYGAPTVCDTLAVSFWSAAAQRASRSPAKFHCLLSAGRLRPLPNPLLPKSHQNVSMWCHPELSTRRWWRWPGMTGPIITKNVTKNHLIKRPGVAKEVAMGILFAIENDFITGTTIDVDGGWLAAQA